MMATKGYFSINHKNKVVNRLDFSYDYIFENEIVKISPLKSNHIKELADIADDNEVWTYFLDKVNGFSSLKKYCLIAIRNRLDNKEYPFVIFDKRVNQYAGMTRLYDYNYNLKVIKVGHTWIGKKFWGSRINTHCKFLLFDFIFDHLELERVGFGVHSQNFRSINALNKIGCEQEGVLRNFLPSIDEKSRVNLLLFSLLQIDWKSRVKAELADKMDC